MSIHEFDQPWPPEPETKRYEYIGDTLSFIRASNNGRTFFVAAVEDEPMILQVRVA
jgi:hypothetical protein